MDEACGMHYRGRYLHIKFWSENLNGRENFRSLVADENKLLKRIIGIRMGVWTGLS
jgi:hypothetical protein